MILINLLKSTLLLLTLWGIFKGFLENKKSLTFNRFYLLFIIPFSCIVPFINLTWEHIPTIPIVLGGEHNPFVIPQFIYFIYGGISILLLFRLMFQWSALHSTIRQGEKLVKGPMRIALVSEKTLPFTFLNTIVVNKAVYKANEIDEMILTHEYSHVLQKHSYDILFVECLRIIFWPNLVLNMVLKSIKLNHEFLADEDVIQKHRSKIKTYQHLLLNLASAQTNSLVSALNYKMTEKRFLMMNQKHPSHNALKTTILVIILGLFSALVFNSVTTTIPSENHHHHEHITHRH